MVAGILCLISAVLAMAYHNPPRQCEMAGGCDVPTTRASHPYTGLGIALMVLGVIALAVAVELRRRAGAPGSQRSGLPHEPPRLAEAPGTIRTRGLCLRSRGSGAGAPRRRLVRSRC